jgi:hypothetical protein
MAYVGPASSHGSFWYDGWRHPGGGPPTVSGATSVTARPPALEGFGCTPKLVPLSEVTLSRRRSASHGPLRAWYAAERTNRPPTWREVAFELARRAMSSGVECCRLILLLVTVAVISIGLVAATALLLRQPDALALAIAAVAGGRWWTRRRPRRGRYGCRL